MTCPRCDRSLQEFDKEGSRFGHCAECGGVWFDFDDLDRMVEAAIGEGLNRAVASGRHPVQEEAELRCPRCEGGLVKVTSGEYCYLACVVCYGRWVDGNDLPRDGGLSRRIKVLFRKIVEGK